MIYDITKPTPTATPNLGKGTECIKLLLSQASKDMYEPLVPMFFPILGAHISVVKFQYPNLIWKESCGNMAVSTPKSGVSVVLNAEFNHSKRRLQPLKTAVTAPQNGGFTKRYENYVQQTKPQPES